LLEIRAIPFWVFVPDGDQAHAWLGECRSRPSHRPSGGKVVVRPFEPRARFRTATTERMGGHGAPTFGHAGPTAFGARPIASPGVW